MKRYFFALLFLCCLTLVCDAQALLGTAQSFAVLGGSAVTNTGPTVVTGNVGVSPSVSITGFPPGTIVGGVKHQADAVAAQAQADVTNAYNALAGLPPTATLTGVNLGGHTLTPGVYFFASSAQLTGTLTLDGQGNPNAVFVFQIGSTLTTASGSKVVLINGASACNVFWQVGSSATLGTTTTFLGNILAKASVTLNTNAKIVTGRALARTGAVTMDTNVVSTAGCPNGSSGGVLAVVTDNSGTRIEFTNLGTLSLIRCGDQDVLCDSAFSVCTSEGVIGVIGGAGVCLLPGTVEFVTIFLHGTQAVLLKPTGTDVKTGAPLYNLDGQAFPIPDGTHVFLVLDNKPAAGCCLGVHEFWDITKGQHKVCVKRKLYNQCTHVVTVCSEKEFAKFCPPSGTFVVHNSTVGASFQSGASLVNLFLDSPGNVGATAIKAGSVSDVLMPLEWEACGVTSAFKTDQEIGNRWLELFFSFAPGCIPLKPGQETFIPSCLEWQCERVPPGTPCPCEDE